MALKLVATKLGKQVSDHALLMFDMQFAGRAFGMAGKCEARTAEQMQAARPSITDRVGLLTEMDPILRAGAAVAQIDSDIRNDSEAVKSALFEAGIITYGRCFNSGQRTHLSSKIFSGELAPQRNVHDALMKFRNKHI